MDYLISDEVYSTGIKVTPLKQISHPKGDIMHGLKSSESSFLSFGEAYFSNIHYQEIKGWKKHTQMTMNIIVPVGLISFYIHDEERGRSECVAIGDTNYARLTVPPGLWVAFRGERKKSNLALNIASIEHDPEEAINAPIHTFPVNT